MIKYTQSLIKLSGLRFYSYHGVLPMESVVGGEFIVNAALYFSTSPMAVQTDQIEDTVNYEKAYTLIKEKMNQKSLLLEHVAGQIAESLLDEFSEIKKTEIEITKCTPPIVGYDGEGISFSITAERS